MCLLKQLKRLNMSKEYHNPTLIKITSKLNTIVQS